MTLLASITRRGLGPCLAVEGATTREVFETYLEGVLAPTLEPGQSVVVMDNLSAHKGGRVKEIIEGRGCELLCTCRLTRQSSIRSSRRSRRSRASYAQGRGAHPQGADRGDGTGAGGGDGSGGPGILRALRLQLDGSTALQSAVRNRLKRGRETVAR